MSDELDRIVKHLAHQNVSVTRRQLMRIAAATGIGVSGLAALVGCGGSTAPTSPPAAANTPAAGNTTAAANASPAVSASAAASGSAVATGPAPAAAAIPPTGTAAEIKRG